MKSRDEIVLEKILQYIDQIKEASNEYGNTYDAFANSSVYRNACCMCVLQIGELCKVVSKSIRDKEKQVPWKEWCGIRDVFAHQYTELNIEVAWNTIEDDIPILEENVKNILRRMKDTDL